MMRRLLVLPFLCSVAFVTSDCAHRRTGAADLPDVLNFFSPPSAPMPEIERDETLWGLIPDFIKAAAKRGVVVKQSTVLKVRRFVFVDKLSAGGGPGVMAVCSRYNLSRRNLFGSDNVKYMVIEVDRKAALDYAKQIKHKAGAQSPPDYVHSVLLREVLYHEFIHCFCEKGHLPDGMDGLMSPTFTPGSERAFENWEGLLDDAFSPEFWAAMPNTKS